LSINLRAKNNYAPLGPLGHRLAAPAVSGKDIDAFLGNDSAVDIKAHAVSSAPRFAHTGRHAETGRCCFESFSHVAVQKVAPSVPEISVSQNSPLATALSATITFESTNGIPIHQLLYILQYPRSLVDGAGSQRFLCRALSNGHCRRRRVARGDGGHDARIGDSQPVDAVYE
jgi:hypothetical protein